MRYLFPLLALALFVQEPLAQVRTFSSPDLKGLRKAVLETDKDGTERLIGFWNYRLNPYITGGIIVFDIEDNQLQKVWEDNSTLSFVEDWDVADLNGDGILDFAAAGSGTIGEQYHNFIALYLSEGQNQYRIQRLPQPGNLYNVALGDIDGDGFPEIVFTEQFDSHPDSEACTWLELEIKIGRWQNGSMIVQSTGITLDTGDEWFELNLGDINNDGRDEAVLHQYDEQDDHDEPALGRSVLVYDLSGEPTIIETIQRPSVIEDTYPKVTVSRTGQILEFKDGSLRPDILNTGNGLFKLAVNEIPEVDLTQWKPVQIEMPTETTTLVLSQPASGKGDARQLTIYDSGE